MTPVSLFTVALGALVVAVGAATLLAPLRTRRGGAALDRTAPDAQPYSGLDDGPAPPFVADGDDVPDQGGSDDREDSEAFVRGFTMVVLGLVCLLWGVMGL